MAADRGPETPHANSVAASDLAALLGGAECNPCDDLFAVPDTALLPRRWPEPPAETRADLATLAGATAEPATGPQRQPERQPMQREIDALLARLLGS
jgi:hypothetical protein